MSQVKILRILLSSMLAMGLALPLISPVKVLAETGAEGTADPPLALLPSTIREDAFVPESKKQTIASLEVSEVAPRIARKVMPEYPELAHSERLEGMVYARLLVDESGKVIQVGEIKGQLLLREAVREAVHDAARQWDFIPARQGDRPIQTWVIVPFSFEL